MLWESQTATAIDLIRRGKGASDEKAWDAIRAAAQKWKPEDFDREVGKLRDQYEGRGAKQLEAAARKRFPFTFHKMPQTPFNWAKLYAQNSASVYDWPAQSYLERTNKDGTKAELSSKSTGPDKQRASDFDAMILEAGLQVTMAEAERHVVLGSSIFLYVYSDSVESRATGKPPRTRVSSFWGTDVWVIPHPAAPASLAACAGIIVRTSSPEGVGGGHEAFILWSRSYTDDALGLPSSYSPWRAQRILVQADSKGNKRVQIESIQFAGPGGRVQDTYPLPTLPFVAWHDGIPSGCPYLTPKANLTPIFDAANTALMAEQYASDMSSATPLIRKTNAAQPKTIALGPGIMPAVPLEDEIIPIAMSADFEGMRSVTKGLLGAMALTNRQRTEGYDVEAQGQPVSGVALKIKGEPQAKARLEAVARAIEVHEKVLALMIEVHDFYRGTKIADPAVSPRMRPTDPPEYEDREVTVRRWITLRDAGLATDAQVMVQAGVARTPEEAEAMLAAIKVEKDARANRRAALVGEPETDQLEDEQQDPEDDAAPVDTEV
jgi:hypothetical protein